MAFKGYNQRWRKMLGRVVFALNGLWIGGNKAENKISSIKHGTASYGTMSITASEQVVTTASLEGAEIGDYVLVALNEDQDGLVLSPYVSTTNVVSVVMLNNTGSEVTIGPGTLDMTMIKR